MENLINNLNQRTCFICNNRFNRRNMSLIVGDAKRELATVRRENAGLAPLDVEDDTRLCFPCNVSIVRELEALEEDPSCLRLNILTQTNSRTCFVCNARHEIRRLSTEIRVNIYIATGIFVPVYAKCCAVHLDGNGSLLQCLLPGLRFINRPCAIKGTDLADFISHLRQVVVKKRDNSVDFFDETSFSDEDFKILTSLTKDQFANLYQHCEPVPVEGQPRSRHVSKKDLMLFLCKLRQGLSDEFLRVIFKYSSRQNVSLIISVVRQSLLQRFVPENIGFGAIAREDFIANHVSEFANHLYNADPNVSKAIVYIDGTYCYIPKSSNHRVLRQSYCVYKKRHLLKPALIVAPDGYILDIHGPYFSDSRNNDAAMLMNEYQRDVEGMRAWFEGGDIVIVDRGYRDAVPFLEALGIESIMPALLMQGQRQLSTEEANESRLVTKTRWIVEARNGHLRSKIKFFAGVIPIVHAVHIRDFYRIAGAIINKYHPTINMEGANAELARSLLERANTPNVVQARVEVEMLHLRNARWIPVDENTLPDFPNLDLQYLRDLTVGVYQVNLAPGYIQDQVLREEDNALHFDQLSEESFLRFRVFSRHRNATRYQMWVAYRDLEDPILEYVRDPILGYYCTCSAGARTLGCCCHVASVIWYLGYARRQPNVKYPQTILTQTIADAGNRPPQE